MAGNDPQGSSQGSGAGWLIGGGVLAAALLVFIFQNRETVAFNWLFWTFTRRSGSCSWSPPWWRS